MNKFYADTRLAQQITDNNSGCFVEPLEPQPPEGYEYWDYRFGKQGYAYFHCFGELAENYPLKYPSGEYVLYAPKLVSCTRGSWTPDYRIYTKSVPTKTDIKLTVQTRVCRLQELTPMERIMSSGIERSHLLDVYDRVDNEHRRFREYWNALYTKPRKTADGKGYVCYPYDSNYPDGWSFDIELDGSTEYKGLPLTIHANCMVEVRNWTKEMI